MAEEYVDAIREGSIVTVTLSQARREDLVVIRKSAPEQPKQAPAPAFARTSDPKKREDIPLKLASKWHSYQSEYRKNNVVKDLIDNFHWEILKGRKAMNVSRKQLASAVGESEDKIKMIENGEVPSDNFIILNKIQSYLKINLRKDGRTFDSAALKPNREVTLADLQKAKEAKKDEPEIEIIE